MKPHQLKGYTYTLMVEKIRAVKPSTYLDAVKSLPSLGVTIPSSNTDLVLGFLRKTLETTNTTKEISLEDRITKIREKEFEDLEESSFTRSEELFSFDSALLHPDSRWAYFYGINEGNFHKRQTRWSVTRMAPSFPQKNRYELICIQTKHLLTVKAEIYDASPIFTIGLVTKSELKELKDTLIPTKLDK